MKLPNNGKATAEIPPHKKCMPNSMPEREGNSKVPSHAPVVGHSPMVKSAAFKTGKSG